MFRTERVESNARRPPPDKNAWCWWCCHPFETTALALPVEYDDKRDLFGLVGAFCSWGCVKAYNADTTGYLSGRVANNITLLRKRVEGRVFPIKAAPPRQTLAVFGGPLSIEEFRSAAGTYKLLPKNVVHRAPNIVHVPEVVEAAAAKKKKREQVAVDFDGAATSRAEPLRLRRAKPATNHRNTLEATSGITFFKKK